MPSDVQAKMGATIAVTTLVAYEAESYRSRYGVDPHHSASISAQPCDAKQALNGSFYSPQVYHCTAKAMMRPHQSSE